MTKRVVSRKSCIDFCYRDIESKLSRMRHEFDFFEYLAGIRGNGYLSGFCTDAEYWYDVICSGWLGFDEIIKVLRICPNWKIYIAVMKLFIKEFNESVYTYDHDSIDYYTPVTIKMTRQIDKKKIIGMGRWLGSSVNCDDVVGFGEMLYYIFSVYSPCRMDIRMDGAWRVLQALQALLFRLKDYTLDDERFEGLSVMYPSVTFAESLFLRLSQRIVNRELGNNYRLGIILESGSRGFVRHETLDSFQRAYAIYSICPYNGALSVLWHIPETN